MRLCVQALLGGQGALMDLCSCQRCSKPAACRLLRHAHLSPSCEHTQNPQLQAFVHQTSHCASALAPGAPSFST